MNDIFIKMIICSLFTFSMTTLGSAAVYLFKKTDKKVMDILLSLSAGIMLASAIFSLLIPAINEAEMFNLNKIVVVSTGLIIGSIFILLTSRIVVKKYDSSFKSTLILIISIIMHNIPEGASIGIAFGAAINGDYLDAAISLAIGIGIQNVPEGAAISIPLRANGWSKNKSFILGILSGIVEPIAAIIGFIFVTKLNCVLPYFLAFAAGTMIYVIISDLLPEIYDQDNHDKVGLTTIAGFILMIILELII